MLAYVLFTSIWAELLEKLSTKFPSRFDSNQAALPRKMDRGQKLLSFASRDILLSRWWLKGLISCAKTTHQIFIYAKKKKKKKNFLMELLQLQFIAFCFLLEHITKLTHTDIYTQLLCFEAKNKEKRIPM